MPADNALACLESLERAGVPYCLLRRPDGAPRAAGSDIDFVVPPAVLPARVGTILRGAAEQAGCALVQAVDHDSAWSFVVSPPAPRDAGDFLHLDAWPAPDVAGLRFYSGDELLASRHRHGGGFVPAVAIEFGCALTRRLVKDDLTPQHIAALAALYARDPAGCDREIGRFWKEPTAREVMSLARAGAWESIAGRAAELRAELLRGAPAAHPLGSFGQVLGKTLVRARRLVRPTNGIDVAFLGPDGAGKSTIMELVRSSLGPAFSDVTFRGGPPSLRQVRDGTYRTRTLAPAHRAVGRPHGLPPHAGVVSFLKAGYWFLYWVLGYSVTVRPALARGQLVLHHRHLVDTLVDPRRYRYGGPAWILRLLWRLTPKPDVIILLDAPAEVIRARKGELPADEIERQLEGYRALVRALPNGHVVDAAQSPEKTAADTSAIVLAFMAERTASRLAKRAPRAR